MIPSLMRRIGERGWSDPARVGPDVIVPVADLAFGARCQDAEGGFGYLCSRAEGHTGRHACYYVSETSGRKGHVLAVWA